jgi:spectinomycin phosphotransferase
VEIESMVERAAQLALVLQQRRGTLAICHSDLHGGNVLVGAGEELAIVDWDEPILAPKERDLMFIGGGVGGIWNDDQETSWFYQGYGQAEIDLPALSYYRYERIIVDIAEYAEQIFGMHGSGEERQKGLGLINQFLPNNVVDIAHRTYRQLS